MAYDDLPLGDPRPRSAPATAPPSSSVARWVGVGAAGVIVVALLVFWWLNRVQVVPAPPAPTTATDVALEASRPIRQQINLPLLDDSDTLLRQLVATLSEHPQLARLLTTPALARAMTLAVVQIGEGRTPATPLKVLRPATHVQIQGTGTGRLDPASYGRWDSSAAALTSISPAAAAQLYVNIKPLIDQAYHELGHTGDFDEALVRAIQMIADTPDIVEDPQLLHRQTYFEHDDPNLRGLRPVQKQFLLMGPANRQKVLTWLNALAKNLDLKTN